MASNYQPIFANGERVGSSMTIDPSKLGKGSIIFAPNGSAPRVMQQDDFFHKIPDKGPLVRSALCSIRRRCAYRALGAPVWQVSCNSRGRWRVQELLAVQVHCVLQVSGSGFVWSSCTADRGMRSVECQKCVYVPTPPVFNVTATHKGRTGRSTNPYAAAASKAWNRSGAQRRRPSRLASRSSTSSFCKSGIATR